MRLILIILLFASQAAFAGGGIAAHYDYLNYVQDARNAVSNAESLNTQIQMLHNTVLNTNRFSDSQYSDLGNLVGRLNTNMQQGQAVSYAAANEDALFRKRYTDYLSNGSNVQDYGNAYKSWSQSTLASINNSLKGIGIVSSDFASENRVMQVLRTQGSSVQGRMQALQVATEISSENVNQLQELKSITSAQAQAQDSYMAYKMSKDSYEKRNMDDVIARTNTAYPTYKNNSNFGEIKSFN